MTAVSEHSVCCVKQAVEACPGPDACKKQLLEASWIVLLMF